MLSRWKGTGKLRVAVPCGAAAGFASGAYRDVVARFLFTIETPKVHWYAQHQNAEKGQFCLSKRSYISYNSINQSV